SNDVRLAVAVEVRRRESAPPTGAGSGETGGFGAVFEAGAGPVAAVADLAPFERDEEIGPAVGVEIGGDGGGGEADRGEVGREGAGGVFETASAVEPKGAARGAWVFTGRDTTADENVGPAIAVEVGGDGGADADRQYRQGVG